MKCILLKKIILVFLIFDLCVFSGFCWLISDVAKTHSLTGTEMTIDYHVVIGHEISKNEKRLIQEIISRTFKEIDNIYNNWNPESELSKLNQLKAGEVVSLSQKLESFLFLADNIVKLSGGKFDPTIEPLQQLWKAHVKNGKIPSSEDIQSILPAVGWHRIHFGNGKFYKDHDNTSLDLGGIAKGYCVDLLVERLVGDGFNNVLVEWGGEIRANGMHPDNRPWNIVTSHLEDADPEHAIAHISLYDQSIATSGDYFQNWIVQKDGVEKTFFHIIDPITGKLLEATQVSVASATVVAPTCVLADALATIAMMHPTLANANEWAEQIQNGSGEIKFWLFSREELQKQFIVQEVSLNFPNA